MGKKTGPSRTKTKRMADRLEVSKLMVQGYTQQQIGEKLNLSRSCVYADMQVVAKAWAKEMAENFDKIKAVELHKLLRIEYEAWEQWHRSKTDAKRTSIEKTVNADDNDPESGIAPVEIKKRKERSGRLGDTRYLEIALQCSRDRRKLMGLDAPTKIAHTTPDGKKPFELVVKDMTDEELELLERIAAKKVSPANRFGSFTSSN